MPEFKKNPSPFMLRSGNSPLFKTMGSSPVKDEKHFLEKKPEGPVENGEGISISNIPGKTVDEETIKKERKKEGFSEVLTQQSSNDAKLGKISEGGVPPGEGDPFSGKTGESTESKTYTQQTGKIKKESKTRKRGWFGLYDMGITEALDAITKKLKQPKI